MSRLALPFLSNIGLNSTSASLFYAGRCHSPHYIVPHSSCSCQHCQLGNCSKCNNLHRRACCFVMAFGVTPDILCAEIIPTSIHGLCIAICALTFWIGDIIITYAFPVMLSSVGFAGIFRIYVVGCIVPGYLFT